MITPCVNVRPVWDMGPHRREVLDRFLDRGNAHLLGDGRALIKCKKVAAAKQMAALMRHLGADAQAMYIGGS